MQTELNKVVSALAEFYVAETYTSLQKSAQSRAAIEVMRPVSARSFRQASWQASRMSV